MESSLPPDLPAISPPKPSQRAVTIVVLASLYLLGLVHWEFFFDHGAILFETHDWPKEYEYYSVLREAIRTGKVPYHVTEAHLVHGTDRFLGIPETNVAPQIVLLPFMDTGRFIVWNVWILYTAGFVGCLRLRRRYRLSLLPFTLLFLLFNFNGTPTAHLAVGHSMWCGHFLLSFYFLYLLEMVEDPSATRPPLKLAAALFAIFLPGSFHYFVWGALFVGLVVIFNRRLLWPGLFALATSVLLLAFRIVPAAVAFWNDKEHRFMAGYPTIADLVHGFIVIHHHSYKGLGRVFVLEGIGWADYDLYVSFPGFVLMAFFGILLRFSKDAAFDGCRYAVFDKPMLVQTLLSFSDLFAYVAALPIPMLRSERISSRFLIIPAMLLVVLAAIRMQRMLDVSRGRPRLLLKATVAGALALTTFFLVQHSQVWSTAALTAEFAGQQLVLDMTITTLDVADPVYFAALIVGPLITLASWGAWLYWYRRPEAVERIYAVAERWRVRVAALAQSGRPGPESTDAQGHPDPVAPQGDVQS